MVKPGGTGRPIRVISARLAPLPPSRSLRSLLPSMKSYTYLDIRSSPSIRRSLPTLLVVLGGCGPAGPEVPAARDPTTRTFDPDRGVPSRPHGTFGSARPIT